MSSSDPFGNTGQQNVVKSTNVQVAVRCRPLNAEERKAGQPPVINCDVENKTVKVAYGPTGKRNAKSFIFDRVFGMYSRQEEVFDSIVRPIVDEVLEGFNCTIFAYGQTGTGKTHTMEGDIHSEEDAGIVPRAVRTILENLEASGSEFTIRVSFLELYNEELQDLLNISGDKKLKLCEDVKRGVVCQHLEEITVLTAGDIFDILARGIQQRQTAATLCNKNSSRSHSIFTMKIMIKECNVEGEEVVRHGQLNLVDLAGSECVGRSGAKNDRAREAGSINQSLLTLGRVITALVDHHGHIPYRDSKLTRLLQESLGGKAKTCIIATLSPAALAAEETLSTLDYAYRAKSIKNQPTLNQRMTKKVIMKEYLQELEQLKSQLQLTREKNGVYLDPQTFYEMETKIAAQESQLEECESALTQRLEEVKAVRCERDDLSQSLQQLREEHEDAVLQLQNSRQQLQQARGEVCGAFTELQAAEAVVAEQTITEQSLLQHGAALQGDLSTCQSDVQQLLQKVGRLTDSERQKLRDTSSFILQLQQRCDGLVTQVQSLGDRSSEQSAALSGGVSQMLQQGRSTCSELQAAIAEALQVLLGDAQKARDAMVSSCDGLKLHLGGTNQQLANTLNSLQQQLSDWLASCESSLQQSQQQLDLQQEQIVTASVAVAAHCEQLQNESDAFLSSQEKLQQTALAQAAELQQSMLAQLKKFQSTISSHTQQSSSQLQQKAAALQQSMNEMLQELMLQSDAALTTTAQQADEFCGASQQQLQAHHDYFQRSTNDAFESSSSHAQSLRNRSARAAKEQAAYLVTVESSRAAASNTNNGICISIGSKRKFLNDTTTTLVSDVATAIAEGVAVVDSTSETASVVLTDVNSASSRMQSAAGASMQQFTAFMDSEGEQLRIGVQQHLDAVAQHTQQQQAALCELRAAGCEHDASISSSALQARGNTPQKVASSDALEAPLKKSRSAATVRSNARSELGCVEYEVASAALLSTGVFSSCNAVVSAAEEPANAQIEDCVGGAAVIAADDGCDNNDCGGQLSKQSSHSSLSLPASDASENADPNTAVSAASTPRSPKRAAAATNGARPTRAAKRTRAAAATAAAPVDTI